MRVRPRHLLPTDFYFVPILSKWSQPTQLSNHPPWAKWLASIPRAFTQRCRHSSWMTAVWCLRFSTLVPCAAKSVPSLCCSSTYKEIRMALWCKRTKGPTLSSCGWGPRAYCQLSWHLQSKLHASFFHEQLDSRPLRGVWSNYCAVFIFLWAPTLQKACCLVGAV